MFRAESSRRPACVCSRRSLKGKDPESGRAQFGSLGLRGSGLRAGFLVRTARAVSKDVADIADCCIFRSPLAQEKMLHVGIRSYCSQPCSMDRCEEQAKTMRMTGILGIKLTATRLTSDTPELSRSMSYSVQLEKIAKSNVSSARRTGSCECSLCYKGLQQVFSKPLAPTNSFGRLAQGPKEA